MRNAAVGAGLFVSCAGIGHVDFGDLSGSGGKWATQLELGEMEECYSFVRGTTSSFLAGHSTDGVFDGDDNSDFFVQQVSSEGKLGWAHKFGNPHQHDVAKKIITMDKKFGGLLIAGSTYTEDYAGGSDVYLAKLDDTGYVEWTQMLGTRHDDELEDVVATDSGVIIGVGYTSGDTDEIPAVGLGNAVGMRDALVVAVSASDGHVAWMLQYGTPQHDKAKAVALLPNGKIMVVGYTEGEVGSFGAPYHLGDILLASITFDGTVEWTKQHGSDGTDMGLDIVPIGGDNPWSASDAIVVGIAGGKFMDHHAHAGSEDALVMRIGPDGTMKWVICFGSTSMDMAETVTVFGKDIFVGGTTDGVLPTQKSSGDFDVFIARVSADGTLKGIRQFGTPQADWRVLALEIDAGGRAMIAGKTQGDVTGSAEEVKSCWVLNIPHITDATIKCNGHECMPQEDVASQGIDPGQAFAVVVILFALVICMAGCAWRYRISAHKYKSMALKDAADPKYMQDLASPVSPGQGQGTALYPAVEVGKDDTAQI